MEMGTYYDDLGLDCQAGTNVGNGCDPPRLGRNSPDPLSRGIPAAGGATFRRALPTWGKTV